MSQSCSCVKFAPSSLLNAHMDRKRPRMVSHMDKFWYFRWTLKLLIIKRTGGIQMSPVAPPIFLTWIIKSMPSGIFPFLGSRSSLRHRPASVNGVPKDLNAPHRSTPSPAWGLAYLEKLPGHISWVLLLQLQNLSEFLFQTPTLGSLCLSCKNPFPVGQVN